ncbi:hypothetical protein EVAR_59786_1 [Eumeta japonica]|uniref:Uncharacterized protein n=1 Tax=Eumeta variegata TaxID=151549 RepID=A0A4C1YFJ2_EUMVA|nr:hypothetical protein EVAR_59786_1 [Eumeta japonica]
MTRTRRSIPSTRCTRESVRTSEADGAVNTRHSTNMAWNKNRIVIRLEHNTLVTKSRPRHDEWLNARSPAAAPPPAAVVNLGFHKTRSEIRHSVDPARIKCEPPTRARPAARLAPRIDNKNNGDASADTILHHSRNLSCLHKIRPSDSDRGFVARKKKGNVTFARRNAPAEQKRDAGSKKKNKTNCQEHNKSTL